MLNRREFIKITVIGGVALTIPFKLFNHKDNETKFFEYILATYSPYYTVAYIKRYSFKVGYGELTKTLRAIKKRQPELLDKLRKQLIIEYGSIKKYSAYNSKQIDKWHKYWWDHDETHSEEENINKTFNELETKFSLGEYYVKRDNKDG